MCSIIHSLPSLFKRFALCLLVAKTVLFWNVILNSDGKRSCRSILGDSHPGEIIIFSMINKVYFMFLTHTKAGKQDLAQIFIGENLKCSYCSNCYWSTEVYAMTKKTPHFSNVYKIIFSSSYGTDWFFLIDLSNIVLSIGLNDDCRVWAPA